MKIWKKRTPGRGNGRCKGPEASMCFTRLKRSTWLELSGAERARGTLEGDKSRNREPDGVKTLTESNSQLYGNQLEHFKKQLHSLTEVLKELCYVENQL